MIHLGRTRHLLRHIFVENLALKILAVFIGFSMWFFVSSEQMTDRIIEVPVEIINKPPNLEIANDFNKSVLLQVQSPQLGKEGTVKNISATLDLKGAHQGENAAVALSAAEAISRVWRPLDPRESVRAVGRTRWEGRLETVRRHPPVILDGAHNPEGAAALAAYLRDSIRRPVVLVFDAMKDKDIRRIGGILFPRARRIILTRVPMDRAASPEDVLGLCREYAPKILIEPNVRKALDAALAEAGARTPVVVAGSLFLVGAVKKILA